MDPMIIKKAEFVKSSTQVKDCPSGNLPEYAFIGRSNVGKSSLINMLCKRAKLAKTSSTPGKTQLINHFMVNNTWYLVDLPGYGYAKMPESERQKMTKMIRSYILDTENLVCLFLLIDSRLSMQKADREFLQFLGSNGVPFVLVFTKTDKLTKSQLSRNIEEYKISMHETWESMPAVFLTSALKKKGRDEILEFINSTLGE